MFANKNCYNCHETERETVFELDATSAHKAETVLKSPEFQKVLQSPDSVSVSEHQNLLQLPNFQQVASEKPVATRDDDLYTLRPTKVATPIRVSSQQNRSTPPSGTVASAALAERSASGGYGPSHAAQYATLPGGTPLQVSNFLEEPGGPRLEAYLTELDSQKNLLARDVSQQVHQELWRTKQSLGSLSEETATSAPYRSPMETPPSGMEDPDHENKGASNDVADDRERRKMALKAEVAALREQVLKAKAGRLNRVNSMDREFSLTASTPSTRADSSDFEVQPLDVAMPRPDLWGARRRVPSKDHTPTYADPRSRQQCGADRFCFPARQCA